MNGKRRQFQHLMLVLVVLVATLGILPLTGPTAARHSLSTGTGEFIVYLPGISNFQPGTGGRIYAYSDAAIVLPNDVLLPMLQMQKAQICQVRAAANPITLQQALQNGWAYLTQQVGSADLAMFRAAAEVATPEGAQAFAFAAMSDRRPDGALAAMLHAHELEPQSPLILINAAGMFATLDMPNEAIALLDAAAALPEPVAAETPMGIPAAHLAANNRAYALLLQGRWQQAEAILDPLVQSGTDLSEARLNLSQAHLCQDEDEDAVRMYRLGARRLLCGGVTEWDPPIQLPPDLTLNRSAGKLFTLPPLGTFQKPEQAESVMNHLNELIRRNTERGAELLDLIDANSDARNQRPRPGPLTAARFNNIYTTAMRAMYEPDIEALYQAAADKDTRLSELLNEQADEWLALADDYPDWNAYVDACRSLLRSHVPQWMSEYAEFEANLETYTTAKYAAMTGAAANLADFLNHEYVMLNIESEMNNDVDWRLGTLNNYAITIFGEWNYCQGVPEATQNEDSQAQYDRPDRCPDALTRGKLGINFLGGLVQIRVNCEVVEVEVSGPSLLTVFGQVTVNMRNKTATFFAGGKIQSPTGMGRLSVNEGFFVSVGENGISDLGMRVTSSADVGSGQFVGVIDGPGIEFGVAAAVEYLTMPTPP